MESPAEKHKVLIKKLQKNTGKSIEQWLELMKKRVSCVRKDQIEWLKIKYSVGSDDAKMIVKLMHGKLGEEHDEDLIIQHFQNGRDYLKPVYEKLIRLGKKAGKVTVIVNKSYISLLNSRQFAILKITNNGLIFGVAGDAIKAAKSKNFVPVKNFGSNKITHKILLNDIADVNEEVEKVLTIAFKKN